MIPEERDEYTEGVIVVLRHLIELIQRSIVTSTHELIVEVSRTIVLKVLHRGDLADVGRSVGLGGEDRLDDARVVVLMTQVKGPANEADLLDGGQLHVGCLHGRRSHQGVHNLVVV